MMTKFKQSYCRDSQK